MAQKDNSLQAVFSLVLGILGLFAWLLPLIGFPVTIGGLILGILGLSSSRRKMAIAGIILSGLFLLFTIGNSAVGMYLGATGQLGI